MGIGSDQVEINQGQDQGNPRAARAVVVERRETRQCQLRRDTSMNMNMTWTGAVDVSRVPVSRGKNRPACWKVKVWY